MSKILIWDIETAPIIMAGWGLWRQDHNPVDIIQDWYIICAAWKWLDKDKVTSVSVLDDRLAFKKDPCDDYVVVKALRKVLLHADIIVGHNIKSFDWKKLNTRLIYHGLDPLPKMRMADTLAMAKAEFKFTSNKLDYVAQFLGVGAKIPTTKGLWMRCLKGDVKSIKEMVKYCKGDIAVSESVYLKLRPFSSSVNMSSYLDDSSDKLICPKCGDKDAVIQSRGTARTGSGLFNRYQCQGCAGWSRGKVNLLAKKFTGRTLAESTLTGQ